MAVNGDSYGYFWDSSDGDRKYSSNSFAKVFNQFFTTGVFNGNFGITANGGMEIKCSGGYANIQGRIGYFDETLFTLEAAHSTYPRRDAIVVACDYVNRKITLRVEQGQYSSTNAPRYYPTRSDEVYELVVGYVYVGAGVTEITTANIEDYRFSKVACGIVTGTVEEINVEQLTTKLEYNFTQWFKHIKGQLSTDAAGNLQKQIDELVDNLTASQIDYSNTNSGLESTKIQGAIDEVVERIATVEPTVKRIDNQLTANSKPIYLDYHDGKYGYNTNPERGADTFNPFNNGGNRSIFKLGALGGTFNLSDYADHAKFTVANNFYVQITSDNASFSGVSAGRSGSANFDGGCGSCSANISSLLSYNASTGILTTKNSASGSTVGGIGETSYDGTRVANWSSTATLSHSISGTVYLIIDESPLDLIYNALVSVGITPESKGEGDIISAIKNNAVNKVRSFTATVTGSMYGWTSSGGYQGCNLSSNGYPSGTVSINGNSVSISASGGYQGSSVNISAS